MIFVNILLQLANADGINPDYIYCFKKTNTSAKGLIYGFQSCYEIDLVDTDKFTFYWNDPSRKGIPRSDNNFDVGCADIVDYLQGGSCYYGSVYGATCGAIYGRLSYLNPVLPIIGHYKKSIFDFDEAGKKATRMSLRHKQPCKYTPTGVDCKSDRGTISW